MTNILNSRNQFVRNLILAVALLAALLSIGAGSAFAQANTTPVYPSADEFGSWDATGSIWKWYDIADLDAKAMLNPGGLYASGTPYMRAHGFIPLNEIEFTRLSDGGLTWSSPGNGTVWTVIRIPDGMPMMDGWVSNNDPNRPVAERFKVSGNYRGTPDTGDGCGRTLSEIAEYGQPDGHRFTGVPSGVVVPIQGITIQGETRYHVEFDHARTANPICRQILARLDQLILADENGELPPTAAPTTSVPEGEDNVAQSEADLVFCREFPTANVRGLDCPALLAAAADEAPADGGWTWKSWILIGLGALILIALLIGLILWLGRRSSTTP